MLETLNLVVVAAAAYSVVIAVVLYLRSQRQKRRAVTLDYIKRWNQELVRAEIIGLSGEVARDVSDYRSIIKKLSDEDLNGKQLSQLLRTWDFFEELAIAIFFMEADEEMAKEFFFYALIGTYRSSEPAIDVYRKRLNNKALYKNLERLYGKWAFDKNYVLVREVAK